MVALDISLGQLSSMTKQSDRKLSWSCRPTRHKISANITFLNVPLVILAQAKVSLWCPEDFMQYKTTTNLKFFEN